MYDVTLTRVHVSLLLKSILHISVCVFVCVCVSEPARTRASGCVCVVRECVCRCGCTDKGVRLRTCSLTYSASNAHAPYCLRPLWLHHIFRHYLMHSTTVRKKSLNIKCVFWFSVLLLFETFFIVRIQRHIFINVKTSVCKVHVILVRF